MNSLPKRANYRKTVHTDFTQRVVNVFIRTAKWVADQDTNPTVLLQTWTKSGNTFASFREHWRGEKFKDKFEPADRPVRGVAFQLDHARQEVRAGEEHVRLRIVDRSQLSDARDQGAGAPGLVETALPPRAAAPGLG